MNEHLLFKEYKKAMNILKPNEADVFEEWMNSNGLARKLEPIRSNRFYEINAKP